MAAMIATIVSKLCQNNFEHVKIILTSSYNSGQKLLKKLKYKS